MRVMAISQKSAVNYCNAGIDWKAGMFVARSTVCSAGCLFV